MNVTVEDVNSIKRKLTVELPAEQAQNTRKKHLDALVRKARLKGFRPGKAPRTLVAKVYAEELRRDVLEELVAEAMPQVLEEQKLEPVGMPMLEDVTYENELPTSFIVTVELKPTFDSPQWKGLELQKLKGEVTEEMVDQKLEELRLSLGTVKKIDEDRPIEMGDLANVTYQAFDGENELAEMGGGPANIELKDDPNMVEGFLPGVLGMRAGETKDISVTVPEEAEDKQLAGKTVSLRTTLNEIRRRELPELDDELAKDLGLDGVETLAALKDRIRADLTKETEDRAERMFNQQLTQILAGLVTIDVPTAMVEREVNNKVENMRQSFGRNGLNFKKMNIDLGLLRARFRPQAEKSVTAALVLDQIARDNQIEVSGEDIEKELAEMSRDYNQPVDVLRDYYKSQGLMDNLREGLRIGKTLDLIRAEAKITEVDKIDPARLGYEPEEEAAEEAAAPEESAGSEG